jgi:hypothetical protein
VACAAAAAWHTPRLSATGHNACRHKYLQTTHSAMTWRSCRHNHHTSHVHCCWPIKIWPCCMCQLPAAIVLERYPVWSLSTTPAPVTDATIPCAAAAAHTTIEWHWAQCMPPQVTAYKPQYNDVALLPAQPAHIHCRPINPWPCCTRQLPGSIIRERYPFWSLSRTLHLYLIL